MWAPPAWAGAGADTAIPAGSCLWAVLAAALGLLTAGVSALEVITPKEIYVPYGTQGVLSCKFKSKITTGPATTVSWSFRPGEIHTTVSFFLFVDGQVFLGNDPLFKNRVTWAGDLHKKDASIKIQNMQYDHNGTYICDVKNPPDIVSEPGYIVLYVVEKEVPTPPPTPQPRTPRPQPPQPRPPPPRPPPPRTPPPRPPPPRTPLPPPPKPRTLLPQPQQPGTPLPQSPSPGTALPRPPPPGTPLPRPPQPGTPLPRPPQLGTPVWQVVGIAAAVFLGLILLLLLIILVLWYKKKPSYPDYTRDESYMRSETTPADITVTK
ncbi:unnamed protein product [Pipistrellus nathusii]|uniref:Ig-like domain-containing protein n=1 Tax=Pipistrellus nathusii TaxID=59473 RepID=A0ABN9ZZF7_PIPNA